ncbi:tyrosine-protein phosphatase [Nonomuraea antimicrobica]|uniref:Tyrosine-protein phosphatase n=1 Tax=Nonomuraea antimicrobica TaxID=561173 RepID=A0ABP7DXN1_9ACTN
MTPPDRHLDWEGSHNARDLGGLPAAGARRTRWGAVVRSDTPHRLTPAGWKSLAAYGIGTIVDLRNDAERRPEAEHVPEGVDVVRVPIEDRADTGFWDAWGGDPRYGTPLSYRPLLDRKPERCAAAVAAVARARPGGVLIHCVAGRDRTGIVTMLLLALAGVAPADILADHELTAGRLRPLYAKLGEADDSVRVRAVLARHGTTERETVMSLLTGLDAEGRLRTGGLGDADLAAVRARLLDPPG